MAYSANSQKDAAYALANGAIAEYAAAMEENFEIATDLKKETAIFTKL